MFERVGRRKYEECFEVVRRLLTPHGLFLLHTIGGNRSTLVNDAFSERARPARTLAWKLHIASARRVQRMDFPLILTPVSTVQNHLGSN